MKYKVGSIILDKEFKIGRISGVIVERNNYANRIWYSYKEGGNYADFPDFLLQEKSVDLLTDIFCEKTLLNRFKSLFT